MEFKKAANEIIFQQTAERNLACKRIISDARDIIERLEELIGRAERTPNIRPINIIVAPNLVVDVESVVDRIEKLYRTASEIASKNHLIYQLADKMEDIDIQEQSSYNNGKE